MSLSNEAVAAYKVVSLLEAASENSEKILDNAPGILLVLNGNAEIIRVNNEFCELMHVIADDCLYLPFTQFFDADNKRIFLHHLQQLKTAANASESVSFKMDIVVGGSSSVNDVRHFLWKISVQPNPDRHEASLVTVSGRDLTEVYRSEAKLTNIFASLPLGIFILDSQGRVSEVLSKYTEILFGKSELLGRELISLIKSDNEDERRKTLEGISTILSCIGRDKSVHDKAVDRFPTVLSVASSNQLPNKDDFDSRWLRFSAQPVMLNAIVDRYIVTVEDITESVFNKREVERIRLLEKQSQALYECAIRDPLSRLYTRLFMQDGAKNLIDGCLRGSIGELAVVILDIDHFKLINDSHGHGVGDSVIAQIGSIILDESRDSDLPVRYGGEEFLIFLPSKEQTWSSGYNFAERIRKTVEDRRFVAKGDRTIALTISAGIAYCRAGDTLDIVIDRADRYLYRAKNSGRNLCVSQEIVSDH